MDFRLTEEQAAVRELAAGLFGQPDAGAAGVDAWFDDRLWRRVAGAGLLAVCLPEEHGGSGVGPVALHHLLHAAGAAAAAVPLWETLTAALAVARFASPQAQAALLPGVASGERLLTAALWEEGGADTRPLTIAERAGDGWSLTGEKTLVPIAPLAHAILVPATVADGSARVFLVEDGAAGVTLEPQSVMDGKPHARMRLDGVAVAESMTLGHPDDAGGVLAWILRHARTGLASLQAGVCRGALRLAAAYTGQRHQFGRPLASFQAVGQRLADAYIDAEGIELAATYAAWLLEDGQEAEQEVAIAAWWAAEAGPRVLHAAQHVHGGVGVDRTYPIHRYFALAKQIEAAVGGTHRSLLGIGAALAAEPAMAGESGA